MTQKASVAYIGKASEAPAELQGFINFRAGLDKRELNGAEPVAVLRVGAIDCYHVVLLDIKPAMAEIDKELASIEAVLDEKARLELKSALGRVKKGT